MLWRRTTNVAAAGNLLASEDVPARRWSPLSWPSEGALWRTAHRRHGRGDGGLLAAAGGAGPRDLALKVVDKLSWPIVDLRVDWADDAPLDQLRALWDRYAPLAHDYVTRAVDPERAARLASACPGDPSPWLTPTSRRPISFCRPAYDLGSDWHGRGLSAQPALEPTAAIVILLCQPLP